jgi:CRISPR-associated protein Csx17
MLPVFSEQKTGKSEQAECRSKELLQNALFDRATDQLEPGRTSSLYHSGAVGGPNASQGFERKAFANPWSFILTIEGTIAFSGSVTRRLASNSFQGVFPFQTRTSGSDADSLSLGESGGREVWLPLWQRFFRFSELRSLLSEGRSDWKGKFADRGVDFAKAVASLGIDRGVSSFARYAILKGRVGGENYCTAAHLGRFDVRVREDVHLLREADGWIDLYRRACSEKAPARFAAALRRIDSSVFDFCQHGGTERFQGILIALGRAEREISHTGGKVGRDGNCPPLHGLSADWVRAADDQSAEFQIAAALASIQAEPGKYPGLRGNLEPLVPKERLPKWLADTPTAVWNRGSLSANLLAVLERRLLDAERLSLDCPPLFATRHAQPQAIAAFLAGHLDESRIEDLLWGLVCCKISSRSRPFRGSAVVVPLPRAWLLLKGVFSGIRRDMPAPVSLDPSQRHIWDALRNVDPDPRILHLLRAGSTEEALTLAARRCRHADLSPAAIDWAAAAPPSSALSHLAAALLIPIEPRAMVLLWQEIARPVQ